MQDFEENQNIKVPGPDSSCASCYTQNGVGIPGWGWVIISNWAGQIAYRQVFQGDSESEMGNFYFSMNNLLE